MTARSKNFSAALQINLPVLFANIGWSNEYNGTEAVVGAHRYLRSHPHQNSEASAFLPKENFFQCGIGRGESPADVHVVYVAVEPRTQTKRIVGVYAKATVVMHGNWGVARTRHAVLIPVDRRPKLKAWPGQQGIRRWAARADGRSHPSLRRAFDALKSDLAMIVENQTATACPDQTYADMAAREGMPYRLLVTHRNREGRLRLAKIQQTLNLTGGRLICEVPGCGFDFVRKYGALGYGYAHVHHRVPLSGSQANGKKTTLADLAIVCANCHAMIHRCGECRDMESLIPRKGTI